MAEKAIGGFMQVDRVIREIVETSGKTFTGVSRELGHSPHWCGNVAASGRSPALATVADVADVAGMRLDVVDVETGETVGSIEPPRRSAADAGRA